MRARMLTVLSAVGLCLLGVSASAQPRAELIAEGVVRFTDAGVAPEDLEPSVALLAPFPGIAPAPADFGVRPEFFETAEGKEAFRVEIEPGTSLYGTGEVAGPLLRNGRVIECWNYDAYGYGDSTLHLYQSHPWVLAVRPDGSAFGVLADSTWRVRVDLTSAIEMVSDGPDFAVIAIEAPTPQEVVTRLADLTGKIEMPPKWALGYHQCRYSYYPDSRVMEVAQDFRERRIPADVIWMDIDYMDGFRVFTFDPRGFRSPGLLNRRLADIGFRNVWMLDPGIKKENGYAVYDSGTEQNVWVLNDEGEPYVGAVWPGDCVFPDYTNADVRLWWAGLVHDFVRIGIDGLWNDMNEPAVFDGPGKTMPDSVRHEADDDLGGPDDHARYHNLYGMQMVRATRQGVQAANPDRRPFVLTRSSFLGGHRYAATWTGDNTSDWAHLGWSIPMALNLGLSGQPFVGPDIGGFIDDADGHLFARWMGLGALLPFARAHSIKGSRDHEPWSFGPRCERLCRLALQRRARLLPYLYTCFFEASRSGTPVVRPLFFADPGDPALRDADDSFLLGPDVLVRARTRFSGPCRAAMPAGGWARFEPAPESDDELPELYLRRGAILPLGPVVQHVGERPLDPLTLLVHPGPDGRAAGRLFEDDGDGFGFLHGRFRITRFETADGGPPEQHVAEGDWPPAERKVRTLLLRPGSTTFVP